MKLRSKTIAFLWFILSCFAVKANLKNNNPSNSIPSAIRVVTSGNGNPILFLPGFTVDGSIWKETRENLSWSGEAHYFSYAGFNGIPPIKTPWYTKVKSAIFQYIEKNQLDNMVIIGHSMGGNLAIEIGAHFSDKVSKIILVDSLPCMREIMMPNVPAAYLTYDSTYNKQMLNMSTTEFKKTAEMMAKNMTNNSDKAPDILQWILEADRNTWVYGYTDLLRLDQKDALQKITAKILIIGASFPNIQTVKQNFEKQYLNLKNKTITIASNSKHFIMFDQPEWLYATINTFLEDEE